MTEMTDREKCLASALDYHSDDGEGATIIACAGPPKCFLQGQEAEANQEAGCPTCTHYVKQADGSWKTLQMKAN